MSTLFESYEKQYGNLTSEITFKLGKIPKLFDDERLKEIKETSSLFSETRDLLEQMSLEVQDMRPESKSKCANRLECYIKELEKLMTEFKRPRYAPMKLNHSVIVMSDDEDNLKEEVLFDMDMRAKLLNNNERVTRSSAKLDDGVRIALETEEIGGQILMDLGEQREKLQRSRDRLRQADSDLSRSTKLLTAMTRRILQNRFILVAIILFMIIIFISAIIFISRRG